MDRTAIEHEPVLRDELLATVALRPGELVVDATVGHGGHALAMARAVGASGRLIALDVDAANLERAQARLAAGSDASDRPHFDWIRANFGELEVVLDDLGVPRADVIVADLGVSTDQMLDATRGLTFAEDGPLDMRLDDRATRTAADLVNAMSEGELSDLIYQYSQERYSRRIAKRICEVRRNGRIRTTRQLAQVVCSAVGASLDGYHRERIHPATRAFLALRMAVNHEMENLAALLNAAAKRLSVGGRVAVISFHSGEDRVVKQDFLDRKRIALYEVVTKKPIRPGEQEMSRNPRSRSAKLRVARRVTEAG